VLSEVRKTFASKVEVARASGWFLVSLAGASLAAAFGRIPLAVLLTAVALGSGFRLVGRQRSHARAQQVPAWARRFGLVLSVVEVAALVVATDTSARSLYEGRPYVYWAFVFVAFGAAYVLQCRIIAALFQRILRPAP
jgi:hypothetical protein